MAKVTAAFQIENVSIVKTSVPLNTEPLPPGTGAAIGSITNEVMAIARALGPATIAALGGRLAGRSGRKVKIRVGEIEAEASSVKQLDEVLKRVGLIKYDNEPKRIHE